MSYSTALEEPCEIRLPALPTTSGASITSCAVSSDGRMAKIIYSFAGDLAEVKKALANLHHILWHAWDTAGTQLEITLRHWDNYRTFKAARQLAVALLTPVQPRTVSARGAASPTPKYDKVTRYPRTRHKSGAVGMRRH